MIPLAIAEVARVTSGGLADGADGETTVVGPVVIDSRRSQPGALFACVVGESFDGHDFAGAAVGAGAVAVLAHRRVGVPSVIVDDPQRALAALAADHLARAPRCRVVGVTGSSGKTSTKDLLEHVFSRAVETVAAEASFNNELGLPLTVLRITERTRTLVLEYSARGIGHIRRLCDIARPHIAIVTNIGSAHLGEFGTREAIAVAKSELVEALAHDGVAVLNADDPLVLGMRERIAARTVTFGTAADADVRITDVTIDAMARPMFRLHTADGNAEVRLQVHGAHHAVNAAAVVAAAMAAGLALPDIADSLSTAVIRSEHRMQLRERDDGLLVVDDAYNANPDSMRAALLALQSLGQGRKRSWAVLGEMRELGETAAELHAGVGREVALRKIDELVVVGAGSAREITTGAGEVGGWHGRARAVADVDKAVALLQAELQRDDVVLVKASNSLRLWRIADALVAPTAAVDDR